MRYAGSYLVLLTFLLRVSPAAGQSPSFNGEQGHPYLIQHFAPQDYHGHPQNWSVVQDPRGLVYVANVSGVLQYDGESWRLIHARTKGIGARSLGVGADGTVYVGTYGDFGYLKPDSTGTMAYVSLLDEIDPQDRDFADVWSVQAMDDGTYFQTYYKLFRWNGKEMKVWDVEGTEQWFHTSFKVHDRFYLRLNGVGLMRVVDDSLHLVPGGEHFAHTRIFALTAFDEERMLIGTRGDGFFLYDGRTLTAFPTEVDAYVREHVLYHGSALPGGFFALATNKGGVVVIDRQGRLVQVLNQQDGLPDGTVNFAHPDAQGGLWLALHNNGIVRVEAPSPLSLYDRQLGLEGTIYDILRHRGTLYVATGSGLYYLDRKPLAAGGQRSLFKQVPGIAQTWDLFDADSLLFAATQFGIYRIRGSKVKEEGEVSNSQSPTFALRKSEYFRNRFYVGRQDGLAVMQYTLSDWQVSTRYIAREDIKEPVRSLVEEEDGTLWVGTPTGVYRLRFLNGTAGDPVVEHFDSRDGLPEGYIVVASVGGKPAFVAGMAAESVMFRFIEHLPGMRAEPGRSFHPDPAFSTAPVTEKATLLTLREAPNGDVWVVYNNHVDMAVRQPDSSYVWETPSILRFSHENEARVYSEQEGITWLSSNDKLIRYDPGLQKPVDPGFNALIRRVTAAGTGTLIFGGGFASESGGISAAQIEAAVPVFDYQQNDVHIEYAAPSFHPLSANEYQYYLEGHDEDWSPWTTQTQKTFTNLREAAYRFRVRARSGQGVVSREAGFAFRILPPWYRTWWAYLLYLAALLVGGLALGHYRKIVRENKLAQQQALELARERVVNERLQQANRRLEMANESLKQADRLKDELLANTSHELRTPITAILGFTSVLKGEVSDEYREFIEIIEASGHRLLHTVNLMLDFARLRAGMMEVHCERLALGEQVAQVIQQLAPIAQAKSLPIELIQPEEPVYAWVDRLCLERILYNLISNAIKFTEAGGVSIEVQERGGHVSVRVLDTGVGIDEHFLPHLFDPFKQESTGLARSYEGSGLGLAVTAQLVQLMEGRIEVASKKGEGSAFEVWLPAVRNEEQPVAPEVARVY